MSDKPFRVVPLDHTHDRSTFNCGSEVLDSYFRERVTQDIRRRVTACFIALSVDGYVAGYYTLASASVFLGDLPAEFVRKLPRYPSVPAVRMGRLAVDLAFRGQGLGGALLADALIRVVNSEIAAYALVTDAKDDAATAFYRHHGFLETATKPLTLFLPLAAVPGFRTRSR
ncbi:MAG: Acetyltransferase (GNAT) family protein [Syntrophorhabdaceae bacterium PtaU1.Bin034]|nr:MAG: Acetyltransferase (GNAT) family protein [Syntrophorhabdaceae bacterium PtaU1.Bin034]